MASQIDYKRKSLESIIDSLQCFSCKDVPGFKKEQRNRYSCVDESHQLCEKCKPACDCGSLVGKRPNPALKKLLKDLPVFCQHYKTGCREMFLQAESLDDHQQGCIFRQVYCPTIVCDNIDCNEKVLFKDVIDHLKPMLEESSWIFAAENNHVALLDTELIVDGSHIIWYPIYIKINSGVEFFLVGKVVNKIAYFWLYIVSSPLQAKNYAYTLSVTGKSGKAFSCYDFVRPLDKGPDEIIDEQSVFMIGTKIIKEIRNEDNKLALEVTIHDLKEEAKDDNEESGVEDESD